MSKPTRSSLPLALAAALAVGVAIPAITTGPVVAEEAVPTASALLAAMDQNMKYVSRTSTVSMEVVDARKTRSYKMVTYGRGETEAAVEYLEPEREKGTRMLKQGDNLWLYMPRAERVQKISGHMLRQGMMGSDLSYEDMMAQSDFEKSYDAVVEGGAEIDGRPCWKLTATAHDETVTYPKRIMWVDKEWNLPVKQELYALSGMLLKTWTMGDVKVIDGRHVAMRMEISDQLKEGSKTVITMQEIKFGVDIEEEIFSQRWLERK